MYLMFCRSSINAVSCMLNTFNFVLFVNKGCLSYTHILKSILRGNINYKAIRLFHSKINCKLMSVSESNGNVYFQELF